MTNQKSIKKNYFLNLSYQVLIMITPIITTPYVSRIFGPDGIGMVSYAESIVSYFVLFATMGIPTYGQREISYVQQSLEKRSLVFWNTKILQFCISGIMLLIYLVFAILHQNLWIYIFLSCNILNLFFDISWFFYGLEEFGKIILRNFVFKIVGIIYIFLIVKTKEDILLYVVGTTVIPVFSTISLWFYLPQYICKVNVKDMHPFKNFGVVLSLFIPTIAIQIYTVLDKTMIGIITHNLYENGYYEQAMKIVKMMLAIITALGTVMIPRIGSCFKEGKNDEIRRLMYYAYQFVWFLGIPMCFGIMLVADNFVPWFFGEGYEKTATLLKILAFLILAIGLSNVTGMQYLIPTGRQNAFTITVLIGAGVNLCMNAVLITKYQSLGAALSSVMAEIVIAVVQIFFARKELSALEIVKRGKNYFIAGSVMTVILFVFKNCFTSSIVYTMVLVMLGGVSYFMVLLGLRDDFFLSNIKMFFSKLK